MHWQLASLALVTAGLFLLAHGTTAALRAARYAGRLDDSTNVRSRLFFEVDTT